MRKNLIIILNVLFLLIITSCSQEEAKTPNDYFIDFIQTWEKQEFTDLYELISTEAKEKYKPEDFIDRYEKIYHDIDVNEISIKAELLIEEEIEQANDEGLATIPFSVSMDSIAGSIEFEYEAPVILEEQEEESKWTVDWDAGFIFPALKDGGKIRIHTIQPTRGEIIDRNQMPLAINDYIYEVGIVPQYLEDNPDQQKEEIAKILNISVETIESELSANWVKPDLFVPIKKVPQTDEETIKKLQNIEAISIQETIGRVYPLGKAAAHLVGYIGPITAEELEDLDDDLYGPHDMIGKRGLEQIYEEELKGQQGIKIFAVTDDDEQVTIAEKESVDGETIQLTIDVNVQEEIYKSYGKDAGTAVALHPKTGETLALVSSPSFDPNDFLYGMSASKLESLEKDEKQPLINRFTSTFAPGSVIKPITAAIGLNNETIDPNEGIEIKGLTWDNGEGWGDYKVRRVSETNKPVDLEDAMVRSDNIYFAMKAVEMGNDKFIKGLHEFGFTESLNFSYPIIRSSISRDDHIKGEVELANTSYGQAEIEMSALHLATAYTTFLNEGNMLQPILRTDEETETTWKENIISEQQASLINDILREIVKNGTAKVANTDKLAISGKTGTAELKDSLEDEKGSENGWFVGYPTEEEDILIAMMIEDVEDKGTSSYVAEKVKELLVQLKNKE